MFFQTLDDEEIMFSILLCGLHEHRAPVPANFAIEVHMLKYCRALQWMYESKHEPSGLCGNIVLWLIRCVRARLEDLS
jgi:hypothetical protein